MSHEELEDFIEFQKEEVIHACKEHGFKWNHGIRSNLSQKAPIIKPWPRGFADPKLVLYGSGEEVFCWDQ